MGLMKAILSNFDAFAGPIVMLLYPLYASIKAIESPSKVDDQQWLTYWVLYSFVTLVELSFWKVFSWIPFWGYIKLVGACWLVLPQFNGAAFVYDYIVKNKILTQNPGTPKSPQRMEQLMSPRARSSVQVYKDTYGENAYENVVAAAAKEARKYKLSPTKERQE